MRKEGETRGRKAGSKAKPHQGYREMVRTGWTYGTEEEQNWLMREIEADMGVPVVERASGLGKLVMGANRYIALKAIQVLCGMSPSQRNPMGLYRRMEVAMAMLMPGYQTLQRWMKDGVAVEGRPELKRNWLELAAECDAGEYDPRTGGFGKSILALMRSTFVKKKFLQVMENLLEDQDFIGKLKDDPDTLLKIADMVLKYEQDGKVPVKAEMGADEFTTMAKQLVRDSPGSFSQLMGKTYRKKIRKEMEKWDDE